MGRHYQVVNRTHGRMGLYEEGKDQPTYLAPDAGGRLLLALGQVKAAKRMASTNDIELELDDERGEEDEAASAQDILRDLQTNGDLLVQGTLRAAEPKTPPATQGHLLIGLTGKVEGFQLLDGGRERVEVVNADHIVQDGEKAGGLPEDGEITLTIDAGSGDVSAVARFEGGVLVSFTIGEAELFLGDLLNGLIDEGDGETAGGAIQEPGTNGGADVDEDPFKDYDDAALRAVIKDKTGKDPHPAAKRATLEAKAREALDLPKAGAASEAEAF